MYICTTDCQHKTAGGGTYGAIHNPFTDVGFKRIFGQEINKDLLISFLNALLEGERRVEDIRFLDK